MIGDSAVCTVCNDTGEAWIEVWDMEPDPKDPTGQTPRQFSLMIPIPCPVCQPVEVHEAS